MLDDANIFKSFKFWAMPPPPPLLCAPDNIFTASLCFCTVVPGLKYYVICLWLTQIPCKCSRRPSSKDTSSESVYLHFIPVYLLSLDQDVGHGVILLLPPAISPPHSFREAMLLFQEYVGTVFIGAHPSPRHIKF